MRSLFALALGVSCGVAAAVILSAREQLGARADPAATRGGTAEGGYDA